MKKYLFIISAAVLAFACAKEIEVITDIDTPVEEVTASSTDIPQTLTAFISDKDTKTAYDADGKFTWLDSDQVRLLVCEDLSTYSRQGIYSYRVKSLSADSKTAVFTSTSSAGDLTAFVDGTWKSTGIAMYPASALDRFNNPEGHSYNTPWFTLARGNVSGLASDILLTGMALSDNSNFKFSTAMAVLKVTVKNIPAKTAKIKLCTSDKTNYPIDGDFALTKDTDNRIVETTFIPTWVSSFNGYQAVDLSSEGEIASRDFYFNIPANTYPAGTLSIRLEDANGGMIMLRTINKNLTLSRNDCLSIPELAYSHAVSFKANSTASSPIITWAICSQRVRFCVSTNPAIDISEFNSGYTFQHADSGLYTGEYALSSFNAQKPSATGQYYMHYIYQSDGEGLPAALDAANVVAYGTIPFYFISSGDATSFAKQYNFTKTDGTNFWHPGTSSNYATTMTLAVSNDVTKGNLMISELYGKNGDNKKLYGVLTASDATSITFAYNGNNNDQYFFYQNGNYFHVAQGSTHDANVSDDVVFSIASGPVLTCENYLMMKFTSNYSSWDEFISGVGLVFN